MDQFLIAEEVISVNLIDKPLSSNIIVSPDSLLLANIIQVASEVEEPPPPPAPPPPCKANQDTLRSSLAILLLCSIRTSSTLSFELLVAIPFAFPLAIVIQFPFLSFIFIFAILL